MKKPVKPLAELLDSVRDIEGFPIGKDEDILALSDPPYYTACPNPYINDFIEEHGTPYDEETDDYHREPFVRDVSEGKNNSIYKAHSYHTKVPHQAIIHYLDHFTKPGDIVFDGFCGTGMTGFAAMKTNRNAILSDLSPIATFISSIYSGYYPSKSYKTIANQILEEIETSCGWMYKTDHNKNSNECKGDIEYVVWSDVFICPYCKNEYIFYTQAFDSKKKQVKKKYDCPKCNATISKKESIRAFKSSYDYLIDKNIKQVKQTPVLIIYKIDGTRYTKKPDNKDLNLIEQIEKINFPFWIPTNRMPIGKETRRNDKYGYTHIHHFFTKRSLYSIGLLYDILRKNNEIYKPLLLFTFQQAILGMSRIARYVPTHFSQVNQYLSGTLYIGSQIVEPSLRYVIEGKIKRLSKVFQDIEKNSKHSKSVITNQSTTKLLNIPDSSVDYIFTDPPFGSNLMYSELNYMWEQWTNVLTNNKDEAIINSAQQKKQLEYSALMKKCFSEYFRIIKPNRWITVIFHNSKSEIWNILQDSILKAGFVIAQVTVLDKQHKSFKQVMSPGSVKNDLVISAYKPKQSFEKQFLSNAGENLEQDFIKMHLSHLKSEPSVERTEQMLYSKMLAYYVQRGYTVKYDANTFYQMLRQYFEEEDGYWFNKDQLPNYHEYKQKMKLDDIDDIKSGQLVLFVSDEKSAIIWLHAFLNEPKDFQIIHPAYTKISNISGDNVPDLKELLDKNFIFEKGRYRRPETEDEKLSVTQKRERELQKEFDALLLEAKGSKKKIKVCRKQAIIYGFEQSYKHNRYQDIAELGKRLDKKIIENDSEISEFIEVAELKVNGF